ncbi:hypothetical protein SGGMMB4_01989 [Sodalis glossinidius str. 'morsitans']|uniref:Uncharacterized protein n=1 Tax=Sodalis glossinidius (strain morsitans) TaxID=343509 RepID=A0A193QII2_SODGM|nr:hypothetical protein SGGMMB4_01989 [Sodalis glossinidius str. 'morsitans']
MKLAMVRRFVIANDDVGARLDGIIALPYRHAETGAFEHAEIVKVITESDHLIHAESLCRDPVCQQAAFAVAPLRNIHLIVPGPFAGQPQLKLYASAKVCSLPISVLEVANFQIACATCAAARLSTCTSVGRWAGGRVSDQARERRT